MVYQKSITQWSIGEEYCYKILAIEFNGSCEVHIDLIE